MVLLPSQFSSIVYANQNDNIDPRDIRSPLRYPGGKSRLAPLLEPWFASHGCRTLFEPFAGGASVSLAAVANRWVDRAVLVELDPAVAAFWRVVFRQQSRIQFLEVIEAISDPIGVAARGPGTDDMGKAVWLLARNRTSFGGAITPIAGVCSETKTGKIAPRWYQQTLINRIKAIGSISNRLAIIEGDALDVMRNLPDNATAFIDPPYVGAGGRLYRCHQVDHLEIIRIVGTNQRMLATYDIAKPITEAAKNNQLEHRVFALQGNVQKSTEVMLSKNLSWFDKPVRIAA